MSGRGFKIDPAAIRQMSREIEREFAKHPVRIPLEVKGVESVVPSQPEQDELSLVRALHGVGAVAPSSKVDPWGLEIDLSRERLGAALELALADRYVEIPTLNGHAHLTQLGRQLAQRSTPSTQPSTMVHNDFTGATFNGSNIATGPHSSQTVSVAVDVELLRKFRDMALGLIDQSALAASDLENLEADLEVLDDQITDPSVKKKGLKRALQGIEQIAIEAAGSAAGTGITALLAQLL